VEETFYLMVAGKQKERKELGSQYPFQGHITNDLLSLHQPPPPKGYTHTHTHTHTHTQQHHWLQL
jgi:hypothetical protein